MRIYQVGGAVRDALLQRPCQDKDFVVVGAREEEMLSLGYTKVGKSFPVFLHPETKEEYALARKEIKVGKGHRDFEFIFTPDITLEEDASRRDFTCNAIYQDVNTGELIDFYNGRKDIKDHILRHVSEHFVEDPLRVLRMCRFAARLGFAVAPETMALCRQMVAAGALSHLSPIRIWQEIEKALCCPDFYRFIETARACGALAKLLPEVEELWRVPERTDYHPEGNSGEHTLLALKAAKTAEGMVNLSVLFHDIGKIKTDKNFWPSHRHHPELGVDIIKNICRRLQIPRAYCDFAMFAAANHMVYHAPLSTTAPQLADIAIALTRQKRENWHHLFISVMRADMLGRAKADFSREQDAFSSFCAYLEKLVRTASQKKVSDMPEFVLLQTQISQGLRSPAILKEAYQQMILAENPPPVEK